VREVLRFYDRHKLAPCSTRMCRAPCEISFRRDVRTAAEMGWSTLLNGDLVDAADRAGFEAIITADRNLRSQVHINSWGLAVIILSTTHWQTLQRGTAAVLQAL
jgi:hypothetical protein